MRRGDYIRGTIKRIDIPVINATVAYLEENSMVQLKNPHIFLGLFTFNRGCGLILYLNLPLGQTVVFGQLISKLIISIDYIHLNIFWR